MRFGVLGPLEVRADDGSPVRVPELKVRALLADLLVNEGRPVSPDRLIADLWPRDLPGKPLAALRAKVSQLRRVLREAEPDGPDLVLSRPPGYLLASGAVDSRHFEELTATARAADGPAAKAHLLTEALRLWRGPAFADFADEAFTRSTITRLDEQRLTAQEDLAEARLELGEHSALIGELADHVDRHPLRERFHAALMLALYRSGRQNEALDVHRALRDRLADDLGLTPGPEITALHQAILTQDPALAPPRPRPRPLTPPHPLSQLSPPASLSPPDQPSPVAQFGTLGSTGPVGMPGPLSPPGSVSPLSSPGGPLGSPSRLGPPGPVGLPGARLPVPFTELVGRADLVAELRLLITQERLVTLTGPGGVGKTRLALEAAAPFPGGAHLVELAPLTPGAAEDKVTETVATALGLGDTDPAEALSGARALLLLDNCEHVIEAVAKLADRLLKSVPGLHVLATSQEPVGVSGEVVRMVPPLAEADAVRLFVSRASAAAPDFAPGPATEAAVATICRRLDGLPLALELAAARVNGLGVAELAARLDDRFRLLSAGRRVAPDRQRTLRATIEWSWELLTEPERVLLRRLAAHPGGITLEAAEEVCAGAGVDEEEVPALMAGLVDRSLVMRGKTGRYLLLESIAAYGLERLRESGELDRTLRRRDLYYTMLAECAEVYRLGPARIRWTERLAAETANLRASLESVLSRRDTELAVRLTGALAWYWIQTGSLDEACRSLSGALVQAESQHRAALQNGHGGHDDNGDLGDQDARRRAFLLEGLAGIRLIEGQAREAARLLGSAAALREAADPGDPHRSCVPAEGPSRTGLDENARVTAAVRAALDDDTFEAEFARGRVLTPEEAASGGRTSVSGLCGLSESPPGVGSQAPGASPEGTSEPPLGVGPEAAGASPEGSSEVCV
ncbi:BTAD domain-containing putative transcriptional regulator [Spirillospora sp. NPDC048911]|uniref:AfsR/SARP family transcriptional regulator n=1 Tax=Spirillospora sp. NPDC048911 TaxID=3364527 RepID=UPI0037190BCE